MIPPNIRREHVELALDTIDRNGVPPGRQGRGFTLRERSKHYPPKYTLALANRFANRKLLKAADFSGGRETNGFLTGLGYAVLAAAGPGTTSKSSVASVVLESSRAYDGARRLESMIAIMERMANAAARTLVVFPGGWFKAPSPKPVDAILDGTVAAIQKATRRTGVSVSFGLDGRRSRGQAVDQLAIAIAPSGIAGMARKFHPTRGERGTIQCAESWDQGELGYPRIATIDGRKYFLAVCYDGFGIKHKKLPRPDVDAILDHVHGFFPGESEVLFARHGFAGAALQWRVPVFAATVFHDRRVPPDWPAAVRWKGRPRSTMEWSYDDNAMMKPTTIVVEVPDGRAEVRVYQLV
jgi:hypothetical protein